LGGAEWWEGQIVKTIEPSGGLALIRVDLYPKLHPLSFPLYLRGVSVFELFRKAQRKAIHVGFTSYSRRPRDNQRSTISYDQKGASHP
jgi:hypothetical protein